MTVMETVDLISAMEDGLALPPRRHGGGSAAAAAAPVEEKRPSST